MDYQKYITIEPDKRGGKPCIRGMRITVDDVLDYVASGIRKQKSLKISRISHRKISGRRWPLPAIVSVNFSASPHEAPVR
jgi:uncharacterized protein (DUF433 family)